jgi:AAA domain
MSTSADTNRSARLRNLLAKVLRGDESITNRTAKLFLEAISDQQQPTTCIQRIAASAHGFSALQSSLSSDNSVAFFNGPVAAFLHYLRAPDLKTVCGGEVLRQVVLRVVTTPLAWPSFVEAAKSGKLVDRALEAFAWLLLQLLCLPIEMAVEYVNIALDSAIQKSLLGSSQVETRLLGQRIIHIAGTASANSAADENGPGGRHDNDFAEIRKISILPTPDELLSKDPYLPRLSDLEDRLCLPEGLAFLVDAQFRLLREDMLRDLREDIRASLDSKATRRKPLVIENLTMSGVHCDERRRWSVRFHRLPDLPELENKTTAQRKQFLSKNDRFLKHEALACLMVDSDIVTLATIFRDEDMLAQKPPTICLQIPTAAVESALVRIKTAKVNIRLVQLSTALFAYEPVLQQLKEIKELSLEAEIIQWKEGNTITSPNYHADDKMQNIIQDLKGDYSLDLQDQLQLPSPTRLDASQAVCLLSALIQRLTVIQGPPGTGKSFMGSLIAKAIYLFTNETILVVCYTHHALDQFLEDLLKLGISSLDIVRLGSTKKATTNTRALSLHEMRPTQKFTSLQHTFINMTKDNVSDESQSLQSAFNDFFEMKFSRTEVLEYLEFLSEGPRYSEALEVPDEGMTRVGKKGKAVDKFYLLDRWFRGKDAGMFKKDRETKFQDVWGMPPADRFKAYNEWKEAMLKERLARVRDSGKAYDSSLRQLDSIFMVKDLAIMRQKRILACTTTAAAKYGKALQLIAPGVLLVEEAGEILESHILTALGPETKQLVLIGDHKQLRPKAHYDLSVEKGDGYDLNRSLFERLILRNYPHQVLFQQHRMRPEISALVRELTYPDLVDAPKTKGKPNLRGFTDSLIFVNHGNHETDMVGVPEFRDNTSTSSKRNPFEAEITLKCVRYLGQQGYRTDNIAVLTPYLGQLRLLLDELAKDNDPVLNDLDSHDLVRAGLMPAANANVGKPRIRISTIGIFPILQYIKGWD